MDLSREIRSIWTNVGVRLDMPKGVLDNIAGTSSLDTPQKKAFEMLVKWRQYPQGTSPVAQLISALEKEGRADLAARLRNPQVRNTTVYV